MEKTTTNTSLILLLAVFIGFTACRSRTGISNKSDSTLLEQNTYFDEDSLKAPDEENSPVKETADPSRNPTPETGTFIDNRDNKIYGWVRIGSNIWMKENLAWVPKVSPPFEGSETEPYYYVYGYEGDSIEEAKSLDNYQTYGVLYNWTAAMSGAASSTEYPSGVQGACPLGWHLPSPAEWNELIEYLGGTEVAGGSMKATGRSNSGDELWDAPNEGATNLSGFTGLPGGGKISGSSFANIGSFGSWWSTEEYASTNATSLNLNSYHAMFTYESEGLRKSNGISVRCIKNQ